MLMILNQYIFTRAYTTIQRVTAVGRVTQDFRLPRTPSRVSKSDPRRLRHAPGAGGRATGQQRATFRRKRVLMPRTGLKIAIALLVTTLGGVPRLPAQTQTDSVHRTSKEPPRAWFSLGAGGGSSDAGGQAARAAVAIAVSPMLVLTLAGTGVGSFDRTIDSINLLAGVKTTSGDGFLFGSAGLANTSCGSGCPNRTGVAFEAGYHGGGRHVGLGVVAFVIRAGGRSNSSGVVLAFDVGWFGGSGVAGNRVK